MNAGLYHGACLVAALKTVNCINIAWAVSIASDGCSPYMVAYCYFETKDSIILGTKISLVSQKYINMIPRLNVSDTLELSQREH